MQLKIALLALMLPLAVLGQTVSKQDTTVSATTDDTRISHTSIAWVKTFEDRIRLFNSNPTALAIYVEGGYDFMVVIYRDGRVEFTGIPRHLKPPTFGTYPYEISSIDVKTIEGAFVERKYLELEYGPFWGLRPGGGADLYYKSADGRTKGFANAGPNTPPKVLTELMVLVPQISKVEKYACSKAVGRALDCKK